MKFLVIDDEFAALSKITAVLKKFGETVQATNGEQAIEKITEAVGEGEYFDLITVDIQLPDIDGTDLLKNIHMEENKWEVAPAKKIMVSAAGTKENVVKSINNHCDGFVVKPVKRDKLIAKLEELGLLNLDS